VVIKVKYEEREKHTHARIWMGYEQPHLAVCGLLTFTPAEFEVFSKILTDGALLNPKAEVIFVNQADGSSASYPRVQLPPGDTHGQP
jgi:hypothetical protein